MIGGVVTSCGCWLVWGGERCHVDVDGWRVMVCVMGLVGVMSGHEYENIEPSLVGQPEDLWKCMNILKMSANNKKSIRKCL